VIQQGESASDVIHLDGYYVTFYNRVGLYVVCYSRVGMNLTCCCKKGPT